MTRPPPRAWFSDPTSRDALRAMDREAEEERERKARPLRARGFRVVKAKAGA